MKFYSSVLVKVSRCFFDFANCYQLVCFSSSGVGQESDKNSLLPPGTAGTLSPKSLRCLLFNARSLCNKLRDLTACLTSEMFELIFVTESWLHTDIPNSVLVHDSISLFIAAIDALLEAVQPFLFIVKSKVYVFVSQISLMIWK